MNFVEGRPKIVIDSRGNGQPFSYLIDLGTVNPLHSLYPQWDGLRGIFPVK